MNKAAVVLFVACVLCFTFNMARGSGKDEYYEREFKSPDGNSGGSVKVSKDGSFVSTSTYSRGSGSSHASASSGSSSFSSGSARAGGRSSVKTNVNGETYEHTEEIGKDDFDFDFDFKDHFREFREFMDQEK